MQPTRNSTGPQVVCAPLPAFDAADLAAVRLAFQSAAPVAMGQAWQPALSPDFAPAEVRTGWREDALLVFAALTDRDIHTAATQLNERMWELGDTFEMFLRPADREEYVEFHVTPNNQRLQLRIPNTAAFRRAQAENVLAPFLMPEPVFYSTVWAPPRQGQWFVLAEIPASVVCGAPMLTPGREWLFSFCRYDFTRGAAEPVISSTSPHARADFHRQEEWGVLRFQRG
jgi:hypothetical protein